MTTPAAKPISARDLLYGEEPPRDLKRAEGHTVSEQHAIAPAGLIVPFEYDPRSARVNDGNGNTVAIVRRCDACQEWIDPNGHGVRMAAPSARIKCAQCYRDKKPFTTNAETIGKEVDIPEDYASANFADLPKQCKHWPNKEPFLIISGIPGSGKTRSCYAYVRALSKVGRDILLLDAPLAQQRWDGAILNDGRRRCLDVWINCPRLILDDLSACVASDGWAQTIHVLLSERKKHKRPLLFTTASDQKELGKKYGQAIYSRIREFEWVELDRKDWRAAK